MKIRKRSKGAKSLLVSAITVALGAASANAQWVPRSQTNFPAPTVPSWHWFGKFDQKVDTNMSSNFNGSALPSSWERKNGWNGKRAGFPFEFSLWESDSNWTSKVQWGLLTLRIYWNQGRNTWLGGFVKTKQAYANGFFQIKSQINLSEAGWVHGFWMTKDHREIDIYEIKGIGASGSDERNQMPTNVHRFEWFQNNQGGWYSVDRLKGFGNTIKGLTSAGNGATYALLKSANYIEFFQNNRLTRRIDKGSNGWLGDVFAYPQNLILNSEYQDWIANPSNKSQVAEHKIDYVARYSW